VFAGHCGDVALPSLPSWQIAMDAMYGGLHRAFNAFLDGEDDAQAPRAAALGGVTRSRAAVFVTPFVARAMQTLRVLP
jgi:hypothetical protein